MIVRLTEVVSLTSEPLVEDFMLLKVNNLIGCESDEFSDLQHDFFAVECALSIDLRDRVTDSLQLQQVDCFASFVFDDSQQSASDWQQEFVDFFFAAQ